MKKLSFIFLMFISLTSFSQNPDPEKIKFRLTEYLLSCQSIAYSIYEEKDIEKRLVLISLGNKYYNIANNEYTNLNNTELYDLSEDIRKIISISFETYATLFSNVKNFDNPINVLALSILDVEYQKNFLPGIWNLEK